MAHKPFRSRVKSVVYVMMAFLLSVALFVISIGVVLEATVLNSTFIMDNMNSSNYFADKNNEITQSLVDLGYASGLEESFFTDLIDEVMLHDDTQQYLDDYYSGSGTDIDTTAFKQKFNQALDDYIEKNSIKEVDASNREFLVKKAAAVYKNSLQIPLFTRAAGYFKALKNAAPFGILGTTLFAGIIILVIVLTNKWKHRAVRYITYATMGSTLAVGVIPAVVLVSGYLKKISLESRALYNLFVQCSSSFFIALLFCAVFFMLLSIAFVFWYKQLYKRVSEE